MAEATAVPGHQEYLAVIFRRCVLALIGARVPRDCVLQREAVEHMVMLAEEHMQHLFSHLNSLCRMQRRAKPSMEDLALLLFFEEINVLDLERERDQTVELEQTASVTVLNNLAFDLELVPIADSEAVFFETPTSLVPSSRSRPPYMPEWMPALPPEHTYMHTENYSSEVKDLRQVRQKLVEEGRLAEIALQRLIGDRGSASIIELPKDGRRQVDRGDMVVVDQEATEPPAAQSQTSKPRGLSLRISLGKNKKRKEEVVGKRPRVDMVELARKRSRSQSRSPNQSSNQDDDSMEVEQHEQGPMLNGNTWNGAWNGEQAKTDSHSDTCLNKKTSRDQEEVFRAALASFAH